MKRLVERQFRVNRSKFNKPDKLTSQIHIVGSRYFKPVSFLNSVTEISFSECFIRGACFVKFRQSVDGNCYPYIREKLKMYMLLDNHGIWTPFKVGEKYPFDYKLKGHTETVEGIAKKHPNSWVEVI